MWFLNSYKVLFGKQSSGVLAGWLHRAVYNRCVSKLHSAGSRWAGCCLKLKNSYVVLDRGAEKIGWNKQGHLWPTGRPVAAQVEAVNPHLTLMEESHLEC